jgi:hypothetical protein
MSHYHNTANLSQAILFHIWPITFTVYVWPFAFGISLSNVENSSIYVTITILDIIYRSDFYLKYDVSENGFYFRLQVEATMLSPETDSLSIGPN